MSAMVERVAVAMWQEESIRARGAPRLVPWSDCGDQANWLGLARAAMTATFKGCMYIRHIDGRLYGAVPMTEIGEALK